LHCGCTTVCITLGMFPHQTSWERRWRQSRLCTQETYRWRCDYRHFYSWRSIHTHQQCRLRWNSSCWRNRNADSLRSSETSPFCMLCVAWDWVLCAWSSSSFSLHCVASFLLCFVAFSLLLCCACSCLPSLSIHHCCFVCRCFVFWPFEQVWERTCKRVFLGRALSPHLSSHSLCVSVMVNTVTYMNKSSFLSYCWFVVCRFCVVGCFQFACYAVLLLLLLLLYCS